MFITIVTILMFTTFISLIVTDVNISFIQEQYVLGEGETIPISVLISIGPGVNASGNLFLDIFFELATPSPECKQNIVQYLSVYALKCMNMSTFMIKEDVCHVSIIISVGRTSIYITRGRCLILWTLIVLPDYLV